MAVPRALKIVRALHKQLMNWDMDVCIIERRLSSMRWRQYIKYAQRVLLAFAAPASMVVVVFALHATEHKWHAFIAALAAVTVVILLLAAALADDAMRRCTAADAVRAGITALQSSVQAAELAAQQVAAAAAEQAAEAAAAQPAAEQAEQAAEPALQVFEPLRLLETRGPAALRPAHVAGQVQDPTHHG